MKLLVFQSGDRKYALETHPVHCIVLGGQEDIASLQSSNDVIEGLIEIEGRTSAVINIQTLLPTRYSKDEVELIKEERLVVYDLQEELIVFRVKGVKESIDIKETDIQPFQSSKSPQLFKGSVSLQDQEIPLLDPNQIIQSIQ